MRFGKLAHNYGWRVGGKILKQLFDGLGETVR